MTNKQIIGCFCVLQRKEKNRLIKMTNKQIIGCFCLLQRKEALYNTQSDYRHRDQVSLLVNWS